MKTLKIFISFLLMSVVQIQYTFAQEAEQMQFQNVHLVLLPKALFCLHVNVPQQTYVFHQPHQYLKVHLAHDLHQMPTNSNNHMYLANLFLFQIQTEMKDPR